MSIGRNLMMTVGRWDRATIRYVNAMAVRPSDAQIDIINNFIVGAKDSGIWQKSTWCSLLAGDTQQATLLNAWNPVETFTAVNSPIFTQNQGWQGVIANSAYLIGPAWLNYIGMDTPGFVFGQITAGTDTTGSNRYLWGRDATAGATNIFGLYPRETTNLLVRHGSTTNILYGANATIIGSYLTNRINSGQVEGYKNGSLLSTQSNTGATSGDPNNITIFRTASVYSDFKCPIFMIGNDSLTSQQALDLHNLTQTYLTELGTL